MAVQGSSRPTQSQDPRDWRRMHPWPVPWRVGAIAASVTQATGRRGMLARHPRSLLSCFWARSHGALPASMRSVAARMNLRRSQGRCRPYVKLVLPVRETGYEALLPLKVKLGDADSEMGFAEWQ